MMQEHSRDDYFEKWARGLNPVNILFFKRREARKERGVQEERERDSIHVKQYDKMFMYI